MIVREVRLENIKSFGTPAEIIHFSRGVNAVSGPNGAGKSTILEAIGAALFQCLPYRQEAFVREGEASGTITVVVDSRVDGRTYEVVRRVGRAATYQIFDPDTQQYLARGEADVGRWLRQHLQVEPEADLRSLFVDSIGPPQGTLTAAFLDNTTVRRAKFNRLLRVEDYESAYRNLLALESAIDVDRTAVDRRVAALEVQTGGRADLEDRRVQRRDAQVVLARRLGSLSSEREQIEDALVQLDAEERHLRERRAAFDVQRERERHAHDLLSRAQAEHQSARRAADTVDQLRADRQRYLSAEAALVELEGQRPLRDSWRSMLNAWALKRTEAVGKLGAVEGAIGDGERARDEITDLERLIPRQDEAEARLEAARLAKRHLDDQRKQETASRNLAERARLRLERAEASLRNALDQQSVAGDLSVRQSAHQTLATRLIKVEQATGSLKTLRQNQDGQARQIEALAARLASLDEQALRIAKTDPPARDLEAIESKHQGVGEARAAAASHLKFARDSRLQVKGGLCPLLHESCNNIRPGITLEGHFDGEIELWHGRLARLAMEYRQAEEDLQMARRQKDEQAKLERLNLERANTAADLTRAEARLVEVDRDLQAATISASERAAVNQAIQSASEALDQAREAARLVSMAPTLREEASDARDDLNRRRRELDSITATIEQAHDIEAEVAAAAESRTALGNPREAMAQRQQAVERLPALYAEQRRFQSQAQEATEQLAEASAALEEFSELDQHIAQHRRVRDESRGASEAFVAAQASAVRFPAAEVALREAESVASDAAIAIQAASAAVEQASKAYDPAAHQATRARGADIGTLLGETRAQLTAAADDEARLDRDIATVLRLEHELASERDRRDRIDVERQLAATIRNAIRAAGPEITRQLLGKISRTASQINAEILNQAGIELEWTGEYEIVTRRQGETRGFAQLSGGEQMSAALAVRLAATRHLSRIRFAFLDEPTAHLDEARRSNLGSQVQRLQGFDQLVVISHDDTFDGLFGHVIRIVRQDGRSRVLDDS